MEREEGTGRPSCEFWFVFVRLCGIGMLKRGTTGVYQTVLICWELVVLHYFPTLPLFTSGRCTAIDLGLM